MGVRRDLSQITTAVIHSAGTPNGRPNTIEDVDQWHAERNPPFRRNLLLAPDWQPHLKHVGYHYVIEVDGAVRCGRPLQETGAGVAGSNDNTVHILMMGTDQFTHQQWDALESLVRALTLPEVIAQGLFVSHVKGHRDYSPDKNGDGVISPDEYFKYCPGFDVATWLHNGYTPETKHILEAA